MRTRLMFSIIIVFSLFGLTAATTAALTRTEMAETSLRALIDHYWNGSIGMFDNGYPCRTCDRQFHYWWQAHAIDALLDGYELTEDPWYLNQVGALRIGLLQRNGGSLINDYYDDMLWMGLAMLRAYTLTGQDVYLNHALELWDEVANGWNDAFGGGIPWRKSQLDYKNAPSNGPAVILAARLYQITGDPEYLNWAKKIYTWLETTLLDPETHLIWDGINRRGDGRIDKNWLFTYNQGTYIGAGVALWEATGEAEYLEKAGRNVVAALAHFTKDDGIFHRSGQGDGGLFVGIFIRYLVEFDRAVGGDAVIRTILKKNADSAWVARSPDGIHGPDWSEPPQDNVHLSNHLSGVMLLTLTAKFDAVEE